MGLGQNILGFGNSNPDYLQTGWTQQFGPYSSSQSDKIYTPAFGLQNFQQNRGMLMQLADDTRKRQIGGDVRGMLQQRAMGEGPSVAERQLYAGQDRNLQQAMAAQAGAGGANVGLQRRMLSQERAQGGQQAAQEASTLRAQEQIAAQGQLADFELGAQSMNDQLTQFYVQQGLGLDMAQSQANMELQRMLSENYNQTAASMASIGNSIRAAKAQKYASPWGILSDERLKKNVSGGGDYLQGFLNTLSSLNAYGTPTKSALVGGLKSLGEKATATGSPNLGGALGEVGSFIASPKGYLINKAVEGVKAAVNKIAGTSAAAAAAKGAATGAGQAAGGAAAQGVASGAAKGAATGAAQGAAKGAATAAAKGGAEAGSGGGSVASQIGQIAGGLISGTRSTAGTYQNQVPVERTLKQTDVSPRAYQVPVENTGESPNNQGIIGAVVSALTSSGIEMKENIAPANAPLTNFLGGQSSMMRGGTTPKYGVAPTGIKPMYTSGILETAGDSIGGGRSNMWTGSLQDNVLASDERKKKNEEGNPASLRDFLNHLQAYTYDYKEPELDGYGKQFGVMAQDLEKSPVGASFVVETPRGKMVDYGKGFGTLLASQAMLNDRVNKLEGRKAK